MASMRSYRTVIGAPRKPAAPYSVTMRPARGVGSVITPPVGRGVEQPGQVRGARRGQPEEDPVGRAGRGTKTGAAKGLPGAPGIGPGEPAFVEADVAGR